MNFQHQKIVFLGDQKVGKSQIIGQLSDKNFQFEESYTPTVAIEFGKFQDNQQKIIYYLIDLAGNLKYQNICKPNYKSSTGVVFVYDINNEESLKQIQILKKQYFEQKCEKITPYVIVANKCDVKNKQQFFPKIYDFSNNEKKKQQKQQQSNIVDFLRVMKIQKQMKNIYRKEIFQEIVRECFKEPVLPQKEITENNFIQVSVKNKHNISKIFQKLQQQQQIIKEKQQELQQQIQKECQKDYLASQQFKKVNNNEPFSYHNYASKFIKEGADQCLIF